jgi:hypothetical protein
MTFAAADVGLYAYCRYRHDAQTWRVGCGQIRESSK